MRESSLSNLDELAEVYQDFLSGNHIRVSPKEAMAHRNKFLPPHKTGRIIDMKVYFEEKSDEERVYEVKVEWVFEKEVLKHAYDSSTETGISHLENLEVAVNMPLETVDEKEKYKNTLF